MEKLRLRNRQEDIWLAGLSCTQSPLATKKRGNRGDLVLSSSSSSSSLLFLFLLLLLLLFLLLFLLLLFLFLLLLGEKRK